ncbi:molybdopterin-dependent oxidoreductase [Lichenihabitans sp. Uapishka_5]|uniref:molybdopterin-dependent oxidoreductase n=1 Tax=Lichenihabitans sp. Uapishka_5 TaxID=3037302 RepID=UPI0029E7F310|nr:molybdopterin-dependent oxidoreductase [Lichenihabitans sp. Uapishka_5]MDX7952364.1 molybdopterin-dependent oxidoreductase [Lichenihabitans sp. Uapishka_5]
MFGLASSKSDLIVHSADPFNAEPPLDRLRANFITPVADFYIRSHGALPTIDMATHTVTVGGLVDAPLALTLGDIQSRFAPKTVMAVMQCAGNRRADMQKVHPTTGDPWAPGAIGNAEWTGVPLAEVLRAAGARLHPHLHVAFESADVAANEDAPDAPYGVSIPMSKALCEDVLIAWAMNGAPLTREHGAPLRMVVPGFAGVRSPKWLKSVTVQAEPSAAFQQAHDYLLFPPDMRKDTKDEARGVTITSMPLNAAICEPQAGAPVSSGTTIVRGYAIATDRAVTRVDVSPNGGRDWVQATIEHHGAGRWSWTLWHVTLDLPGGEHELAVRAWDAAGQTQPAQASDTWNFKGYLSAAWHRVRVTAA